MTQFIGYTIGLESNRGTEVGKLVKVEYTRLAHGSVRLQAVSGRNLAAMKGYAIITKGEFESRPQGAAEARWALARCGWTLMSDDCAAQLR